MLTADPSTDPAESSAPTVPTGIEGGTVDGDHWRVGNRTLAILAGIMLFLGVTATLTRVVVAYQVPGPFTPEKQGLCDFHNGIYFPARAAIQGQSPYSQKYADENPVARQIPFFSPVILWMHAPLAVLPLRLAEVLNTILQLGMLVGIALLVSNQAGFRKRIDVPLMVAAAVIFTRGGHITLFNGYFTFQLVLATFLAVAWANKHPARSGWMLLIVSAKPTYILPLGFLMLARGNYRALCYGATLSIVGAALSLGWIAHQEGDGDLMAGAEILKNQVVQTQEVHRSMEDESPVFSWTRLDLFAIISKWRGEDPGDLPHLLAMFGFLAVPMILLRRRAKIGHDDGIAGITGALLMSAMLVSLYHQSYDSLLMVAPVAGAAAAILPGWRNTNNWCRWAAIGLMTWPAMNYLSTRTFLLRFDLPDMYNKIFTSMSGVSLALALVLLCYITWFDRVDTESDQ